MSWITPKLNQQVQIGKPIQTENDDGGFDFSLDVLATLWMGVKTFGYKSDGVRYVRGQQINAAITHEFMARYIEVTAFGGEFAIGFGSGLNIQNDLTNPKSDYYLFLECGSTVKGRLFRVDNLLNNKEQNEYVTILAEEVEERGTGYPA